MPQEPVEKDDIGDQHQPVKGIEYDGEHVGGSRKEGFFDLMQPVFGFVEGGAPDDERKDEEAAVHKRGHGEVSMDSPDDAGRAEPAVGGRVDAHLQKIQKDAAEIEREHSQSPQPPPAGEEEGPDHPDDSQKVFDQGPYVSLEPGAHGDEFSVAAVDEHEKGGENLKGEGV